MKSDAADYKIQFWSELELHPRLLLSVTPLYIIISKPPIHLPFVITFDIHRKLEMFVTWCSYKIVIFFSNL